MADDNNERPYRSSGPSARDLPGTPAGSNDPLAELARLIGQTDPFSEYGRDGARRNSAPRQSDPAPDWPSELEATQQPARPGFSPLTQEPGVLPLTPPQQFGAPSFTRQPFGSELYQSESEPSSYGAAGYPPDTGVPGYSPAPVEGGFENDLYSADNNQLGREEDDYYDDVPPNRRRMGIIAIAGVFALAVLGTAGAFGYRAIFGSSSSNSPPPVIKAESTPSKIVPATPGKDAQANKMITDRVNERGQGEKLVSREEQPVAVTTQDPAKSAFPQGQGASPPNALPQLGSGIVGTDPKRIRTIAIRPDQPEGAGGADTPPTPPEPAPVRATAPIQPKITNVTPARPATPQRAATEPAPVQRPAVTRAESPPANAPLSLNPNESVPPRATAPQRTAAAAPPTQLAPQAASSGSGGYAVQVSARRSEADAQAAFRTLQGQYPNQLGGRQPLIKRVDLGAKGIYFRAMVGPFGSSGEASELCSSLKAAGGQCIVQRN